MTPDDAGAEKHATPAAAAKPSLVTALVTILAGEAAVTVAAAFLAKTSIFALVVEVAIAEWTTARIGVSWGEAGTTAGKSLRRAGKGVVFGLGLGALVMTASLIANAGELAVNRPMLATLAIAAATAILPAVSDELLMRGAVLRLVRLARRGSATDSAIDGDDAGQLDIGSSGRMVLVSALVAAARASGDGASVRGVVLETSLAVVFAALWLVDGVAWRPVAAHSAWLFVSSGLAGGGILELRAHDAPLEGFHGLAAIGAVVVAAAASVVAAITGSAQTRKEPSKRRPGP